MGSVEWREHEGIRYLAVNYRNVTDEESLALLRLSAEVVEAEPGPVWMIADIDQFSPSHTWHAESKKIARTVLDPRGVQVAIVGLSPFLRMSLTGFRKLGAGRRIVPCASVDEALAAMTRAQVSRS